MKKGKIINDIAVRVYLTFKYSSSIWTLSSLFVLLMIHLWAQIWSYTNLLFSSKNLIRSLTQGDIFTVVTPILLLQESQKIQETAFGVGNQTFSFIPVSFTV